MLPLDDCDIASAGPPGEIKSICPNLEELDLSKNHLREWREVYQVIPQHKCSNWLYLNTTTTTIIIIIIIIIILIIIIINYNDDDQCRV